MQIYNISGAPIVDINSRDKVDFSDKSLVVFGDSLTEKALGKWYNPFCELANFKHVTRYARGWARWTNWNTTAIDTVSTGNTNTADNVIFNQFKRMEADINAEVIETPDIIFIFAGVNDGLQHATIGDPDETFNSETELTLATALDICKSIRYVVDLILTEYPDTEIILGVEPLTMQSHEDVINVADAIVRCGQLASIPVINVGFEGGMYWHNPIQADKLYSDEEIVHHSIIGGERVANFIYKKFCELYKVWDIYNKTIEG